MLYDYVIIGGGAAGMCTAINLKKNKNSVLLIERNERLGKKILSTGNGRCNLTNEFCKVDSFAYNPENIYPYNTTGNRQFIEDVIGNFDSDSAINWFKNIGLITTNKNGLIYPLSEQASTVLDFLRFRVSMSGVEVLTDFCVKELSKEENSFIINNQIKCKNLVLCCGGAAAPKSGSDGSGFTLAKKFGHTIIKPFPALCGIKLDSPLFKILQGVRSDAVIRVYEDGSKKPFIQTKGNVQFNTYGISGIPAMNVSGVVARKLDQKHKIKVNIEFLPELDFDTVVNHITDTLVSLNEDVKDKLNIDFCFNGLLNKKISLALLKDIGINGESSINSALKKFSCSKEYENGKYCGKYLSDLCLEKIFAARTAGIIKHFSVPAIGVNSFDDAQTTSGGVSTEEIHSETMESKLVPGLYFAGEIIDVDGICGGYNLQWAWASAMRIGENNG